MSNRHLHRRYLDMEPMDDSNDNSNQTWLQEGPNSMQLKRSEMNELIMDYLVHEGFKEAAERFREEAGIENQQPINSKLHESADEIGDASQRSEIVAINNHGNNNNNDNNFDSINNNLHNKHESQQTSGQKDDFATSLRSDDRVDDWLATKAETPEMMDKRIEVRHFIEEGDILKGQSLINLYYPELLDNHRSLYFKLQQQHLIELIRQQKINEVLSYVHEQLSVDELGDLSEMERTLALLAYENPDKSPYSNLLQISHRLELASEVNDAILLETSGSVELTKPRLVTLLKLLLWTQNELEKKNKQFPKMIDLVNGTIVEPRQ